MSEDDTKSFIYTTRIFRMNYEVNTIWRHKYGRNMQYGGQAAIDEMPLRTIFIAVVQGGHLNTVSFHTTLNKTGLP